MEPKFASLPVTYGIRGDLYCIVCQEKIVKHGFMVPPETSDGQMGNEPIVAFCPSCYEQLVCGGIEHLPQHS